MSSYNIRRTLSIAAAGLLVTAAPLGAVAQDYGRPGQHQQPSGPQGRPNQGPTAPAPNHARPNQGPTAHAPNQARPGQGPSNAHQNQGRPQVQPARPGHNVGRYRITSTVNLRSGPGTNFRRLGQLRTGRVVTVDRVQNGWLHIAGQGWISASFARRA